MTSFKKSTENNYRITLVFDDTTNGFREFEQIFKSFRELDSICELFLASNKSIDKNTIDVHSEVQHFSKKSPFELSAFITDHWLEILLFVWGSYDRIRPNAELIFKNLNDLTDSVESTLKDVTADFPNLEKEKLEEILNWFNNLPFIERARIAKMMIRQSKVFRKISKIKFHKK